jgi:hypothetical protein
MRIMRRADARHERIRNRAIAQADSRNSIVDLNQ